MNDELRIICLQCRPATQVPMSKLEMHVDEHFFHAAATRMLNESGARLPRPTETKGEIR